MFRTRLLLGMIAGLALSVGACQSSETNNGAAGGQGATKSQSDRNLPERSTVLGLVRREQVVVVTLSLPKNTEAHQFDDEYQTLMADGVLKCRYAEALSDGTPFYSDCVPGANGGALDNDLSMTIGYKKPSEVNGITKTSDNAAAADLVLTFEADADNRLWRTHGDLLKRISRPSPANPFGSQPGKAFLILYDDGWRVQRVCAVGQMSCY